MFRVTGPTSGGYPFSAVARDGATPLYPLDVALAAALARGEMNGTTVCITFSGSAPLAPCRERWELHGWTVKLVAA